jgi:hypothetical protein
VNLLMLNVLVMKPLTYCFVWGLLYYTVTIVLYGVVDEFCITGLVVTIYIIMFFVYLAVCFDKLACLIGDEFI